MVQGGTGEGSGRREFLNQAAGLASLAVGTGALAAPAQAIGDLVEFAGDARFLQSLEVNVPNLAEALPFYTVALSMKVLRTSIVDGRNVTFLGYGPEQLTTPPDFIPGVSSFNTYGGHFSLKLVEAKKEEGAAEAFFEQGTAFQYLQIAVPYYSIGKVVFYGGDIKYGYGYLIVTAPGGLPLQVFFGDRGDPMQFIALRTNDLKKSIAYYQDVLGMKKLPYPQLRAQKKSMFEPEQPKGSVLMGYNKEGMGVLLLPKSAGGKAPARPGSLVGGLTVVGGAGDVAAAAEGGALRDPDGNPVAFLEKDDFDRSLSGAGVLSSAPFSDAFSRKGEME